MEPFLIAYHQNDDDADVIAHYNRVKQLQSEQSKGLSQQHFRKGLPQKADRKNTSHPGSAAMYKPAASKCDEGSLTRKPSLKPKKPSRIPWELICTSEPPPQPTVRETKINVKHDIDVSSKPFPVQTARPPAEAQHAPKKQGKAVSTNTNEKQPPASRSRHKGPGSAKSKRGRRPQTQPTEQSPSPAANSVTPQGEHACVGNNKKASPQFRVEDLELFDLTKKLPSVPDRFTFATQTPNFSAKSTGKTKLRPAERERALPGKREAKGDRNADLARGTSSLIATIPNKPDPLPVEQTCAFFCLPGELRNQIYGYLYEPTLVTIGNAEPRPGEIDTPRRRAAQACGIRPKAAKVLRITAQSPLASAEKRQGFSGLQYRKIPGCQPDVMEGINWEKSVSGLMLSCKILSVEASSVLYSKTAFFFDDAKRLSAFLDTVTPSNVAMIPNIYVHIRTYGIPEAVSDNVWEQKHIQRWTSTLGRMTALMTGLKYVHITLDVRSMTEHLLRAFRPLASGQDWKERAGHMLMLQPLSGMKLDSLVLKIRAGDREAAQKPTIFQEQFKFQWHIANVQPFPALQTKIHRRNFQYMDNLHRTLTQAMVEMGRSGEADEAFASVAAEVSEYLWWLKDPVINCLREG